MKKLFLLLSAVGMIFSACEGGEGVEEENGGTPFVPEITISPKDLTFGCNGGEQAVDITANFEYEVVELASWLTVEQTDEGLLVVVDANKNTSERSAYISIINEKYSIAKIIDIVQEAWVPKIELAQQRVEVEFEPAEYEVGVTSPYSWEATTKNDWIVVESETGIAGEEVLRFSIKRNEEEKERKGTITLKNTDYNLVAELYIIQKSFVPITTIEPESLNFTFEGGTQEIAITANFEYEFSTEVDWLTIEKSESGIKVTVPNYVEVEERTAEITISNEKYSISKVVKVTQGAFVPAITIEPELLVFTSEGGTQEVAITANFEYAYNENADWLTIKKSKKGVNITATTNTKFEERTAEITISSEKYSTSKNISVTQKGVSAESQNVIIYTSADGKIVTPNETNVFGANIVSNIYREGQGVIIFDTPITSIGNSAFLGCKSLKSVTIPDIVTSIGNYAFDGCTSLTSVTIPDSVISIGYDAFFNCTSLTAFYGKFASVDNRCLIVNGTLHSFAPAGITSYTIPDSVTSIGDCAFRNYTSLTSVIIPDSVTSIEDYAFADCTSLTSVTIPNSVTSIGEYAFGGCTSLTSITIPDSVTSIGGGAFYNCTSLISITIPDSVTSIGDSIFCNCDSLTSVTIPNSVTSIEDYAFRNCTSLTSVTIPNSVTSIEDYAFRNCTSLTRVDITDLSAWCKISFDDYSANPLCNGAKLYINNTEATNITIPSDITKIKNYAFRNCTSLTSVTIPDSVTSIGDDAFYRCTSLKEVYCKPTTPPTGGYDMFDNNASGRKIYVPSDSVSAYKSASYWSDYASYIVGYDF